MNIYFPKDFVAIAKAKSGDLHKKAIFERVVNGAVKDILVAVESGLQKDLDVAFRLLNADWSKLSYDEQARVISSVGNLIDKRYAKAALRARKTMNKFGTLVAKTTRSKNKVLHNLNIDASLSSEDLRFVSTQANASSWYIKDKGGKLTTLFREDAQSILTVGAREGLDPKRVSDDLFNLYKGSVVGRPKSYFQLVAGASLVRSRSYSDIDSYYDAGVSTFIFRSVMDNRTSEQCRLLNGKEFSIKEQKARLGLLESVSSEDPEQVKEITPWLTEKKIGDERFLGYKKRDRFMKVARINRYGAGTKRSGQYEQLKTDEELAAAGVVVPPVHGNCRSYLDPKL